MIAFPGNLSLLDLLSGVAPQPFEIYPQIDERRFLRRCFDPDLPLLIKLYSFPKYRGMLGENWVHWHDYYELILPISGAGAFTMGAWDVNFSPGDLLVVDTLRLHGVSKLSGAHSSLVILFPSELIVSSGAPASDAAFLDPLRSRPDSVPPLLRSDHPTAARVHAAVLALYQRWATPGSAAERYTACKLQMLTILQALRDAFGVKEMDSKALAREEARRERLSNVLRVLGERFAEPLKLHEIAAVAGMGTTLFCEFFKQTTGRTFAEYVRDLRVGHAAQLLRDTDESIAEIAAASGFCDQSYLNRCFGKRYHCSPLVYRERNKVVHGKVA